MINAIKVVVPSNVDLGLTFCNFAVLSFLHLIFSKTPIFKFNHLNANSNYLITINNY